LEPHAVDAIEQDGITYARQAPLAASLTANDRAVFYQLKTMLQGVVQRGTAHAMAALSPYVAGKTGTTEDQNDAWFIGFTNEITIAVWVGYDNAGDTRRTLGEGSTGAATAAPIFESIVQAAWSLGFSKSVLAPPSAEAARVLSCNLVDPESSERRKSTECLRVDAKGRTIDARYRLVSRERSDARGNQENVKPRHVAPATNEAGRTTNAYSSFGSGNQFGSWSRDTWGWGWHQPQPQPEQQMPQHGVWSAPYSIKGYESGRDFRR